MAKEKKITPHATTPLLTWRTVKRSEIPPRPPTMRKGYWDSVIRDVAQLEEDKVLKLKFSDDYFVKGMDSSPRKAAACAGIKVSISTRGNLMYLWVASPVRKPVPSKSATATKD